MRPQNQIVTALLSSKANPASQADACAWKACTFFHCMDMSLLDMDSCWRLPWVWFNQSLRDYWHVSKFPVVRASRWPTSPQHHLQVTIVSTTKDQALSGVRHGCRASVGRPTGSAGGKRDFLTFLACPNIHCGATTGCVDPPRAYKSCGRDSEHNSKHRW